MNEEIKIANELIDILDQCLLGNEITLSRNRIKQLLDLITNLQEENKKLKKLEYKFTDDCGEEESFTLEEYLDIGNKLYDCEEQLEIYKSRNEKAIEYIKENEFYLDYKTGACIKGVVPLLNILQGEDKDE